MTDPKPQPVAAQLQSAARKLQTGDVDGAEVMLQGLGPEHDANPDHLHLSGLIARARGHLEAAEKLYRESLSIHLDQPAVHNNLGNLLQQQGRTSEAEDAYRTAIELHPTASDADRNLGLLLESTGQPAAAVFVLREALKRNPRDTGAWVVLGRALGQLDQLDDSIEAFQQALQVEPRHRNAFLGLGHALRLAARFADARLCHDTALALGPEDREAHIGRARLAVDIGQLEDALSRYRNLLEMHGDFPAAHTEFNELLWQTGRSEEFGGSFAAQLNRHPEDHSMRLAAARAHGRIADHGRVLDLLGERGERIPGSAESQGLAARALAAQSRLSESLDLFATARELAPDHLDLALDEAQTALVANDLAIADRALTAVDLQHPNHQLMWALRGIFWRLAGDERFEWLNDPRLVITRPLQPPPGYSSTAAWLEELNAFLQQLHVTSGAPTDQTLRGGTQTFGRLLHRSNPELEALRGSLETAVNEALSTFWKDSDHPLLRRWTPQWRFSGSWSVRLGEGGYHVNHVHPEGWLSSACYVAVPDSIGSSADQPDGWLQFGQSNLGLGDREGPSRLVRPVAGELTLFPSYTWHGTVPLRGQGMRLTTPFDVVPADALP